WKVSIKKAKLRLGSAGDTLSMAYLRRVLMSPSGPGLQLASNPQRVPAMLNRTATSPVRLSVLSCAWAVFAGAAGARPAYKKALAEHFGPLLAKKLNDCRTCHLPDPPGGPKDETDKPHNAFGARLAAIKKELKRAGKATDIIARIEASAEEDADGDGVSNIVELLTGHFPGDAADKPSSTELAKADLLRKEYRKLATGYRWKPFEP